MTWSITTSSGSGSSWSSQSASSSFPAPITPSATSSRSRPSGSCPAPAAGRAAVISRASARSVARRPASSSGLTVRISSRWTRPQRRSPASAVRLRAQVRTGCRNGGAQRRERLLGDVAGDRGEQLLARAEGLVEVPLGQTRVRTQLLDGGGVVAAGAEELESGGQQLLPTASPTLLGVLPAVAPPSAQLRIHSR